MADTPNRISSRRTFFYKRIFPAIWLGFLVAFVLLVFVCPARKPAPFQQLPLLLVPVVMGGFGFALMRKLIFDLVDEVEDYGNMLKVRNAGDEVTIDLANIININYAMLVNPRRITLTLREPCRLGDKISFMPKTVRADWFSFGFSNQIADDLIKRVDQARQQRT